VTETDISGGTFPLSSPDDSSISGLDTTPATPWDASAAIVQTDLQNLPAIGKDNVGVLKAGNVYTISFIGQFATTAVSPLQTNVVTSKVQTGGAGQNEVRHVDVVGVPNGIFWSLSWGLGGSQQSTIPLAFNATAGDVQSALAALLNIGTGNLQVTADATGYRIEFVGALRGTNLDSDLLTGSTSTLRSNGIHAIATADGEGGDNTYTVYLVGGRTASTINVFDSGNAGFLPPASPNGSSLAVYGTNAADVFLLRSSTSEKGLAFIAMLNGLDPHHPQNSDSVERVNYTSGLAAIDVYSRAGNDEFYIDDTRAPITIHGGSGNNFFQIGQLYQSRRTPQLANVAAADLFATLETTRGWLSKGVSSTRTSTRALHKRSCCVTNGVRSFASE